uniref:F-box domain-containing protein n=1 Tax=Trichogramma kaykai TaxID=54128 RepID=A0ABD2XGK9_9HYME
MPFIDSSNVEVDDKNNNHRNKKNAINNKNIIGNDHKNDVDLSDADDDEDDDDKEEFEIAKNSRKRRLRHAAKPPAKRRCFGSSSHRSDRPQTRSSSATSIAETNENNEDDDDDDDDDEGPFGLSLLSLPSEIHFKILEYLDNESLDAMRKVSIYFDALALQIPPNESSNTDQVIDDLKRMSQLHTVRLHVLDQDTMDCTKILRQLAVSQRKLSSLEIKAISRISYLPAGNVTRLIERCPQLQNVHFHNVRVRGSKLYRLLGEKSSKLQSLSVTTTYGQFQTFLRHLRLSAERDSKTIDMRNRVQFRNTWTPMTYIFSHQAIPPTGPTPPLPHQQQQQQQQEQIQPPPPPPPLELQPEQRQEVQADD